MSVLATKLLCSHGSKILWRIPINIVRVSSGYDNCPPPPCQVPPPKTGDMPCIPEAPEPPPCPKLPPPCPSPLCIEIPDPANPCNYCPPVCVDPEVPDLIKLKKLQCHFQQDNGLPIFLKGGNSDILLYQVTIIMLVLSFLYVFFLVITVG